ncbi:MAG TPA: M81 family metallopeptidase [Alphaproteobacteria bacterium]|nr:M81 family metallopeptidase [Alphaproteobacteria bacterium]
MRLVIAMMKHETNTFSPVVTDWARFEDWNAFTGAAVIENLADTAMPVAAYLKLAREANAEVVTPLAAEAMPSGPVARGAYEHMAGLICAEVEKGCDGALLDLHGAMVAEHLPDGEGELLARIRDLAPELPIAVTCDLHCNLTARMVDNCTALVGYKTYPHVDLYETAERAGRIVLDSMAGISDPVMAWGPASILSQTLKQGTGDEPMKTLMRMCEEAEKAPDILAATVFGGFPMADIADAGTSAIVVADANRVRAEAVRGSLLETAWARREEFAYQGAPLADTVARAKTLTDGPVILLDHADNCGSGANQDVMTVINEVLRQNLEDVAVATVWDPGAVQAMQRADVGQTLTLPLGGNTDMPAIGRKREPLTVTGKVKVLSDGEWVVRGPMYTGVTVHMGPSAVLDTGNMEIVVVSKHHEPWDLGVFRSLGIEPKHKRYLLLKSRIHYRAGFGDLARHTLTLDGVGVTTSDNSVLDYRNVRRPIYPLDLVNES